MCEAEIERSVNGQIWHGLGVVDRFQVITVRLRLIPAWIAANVCTTANSITANSTAANSTDATADRAAADRAAFNTATGCAAFISTTGCAATA